MLSAPESEARREAAAARPVQGSRIAEEERDGRRAAGGLERDNGLLRAKPCFASNGTIIGHVHIRTQKRCQGSRAVRSRTRYASQLESARIVRTTYKASHLARAIGHRRAAPEHLDDTGRTDGVDAEGVAASPGEGTCCYRRVIRLILSDMEQIAVVPTGVLPFSCQQCTNTLQQQQQQMSTSAARKDAGGRTRRPRQPSKKVELPPPPPPRQFPHPYSWRKQEVEVATTFLPLPY